MKIYDLISHRSFEISIEWIDFDRSRKDPSEIKHLTRHLATVVEFHRIFLKNEFKKNTPNKMGILAVTRKVYENIVK